MNRYMDADALKKRMLDYFSPPEAFDVADLRPSWAIQDGIEDIFATFPKADVEEVVPCKDCIYSQIYPNGVNGYCNKQKRCIYSTDFCSDAEKIDFRHKLDRSQTGYGERREDEHTD